MYRVVIYEKDRLDRIHVHRFGCESIRTETRISMPDENEKNFIYFKFDDGEKISDMKSIVKVVITEPEDQSTDEEEE